MLVCVQRTLSSWWLFFCIHLYVYKYGYCCSRNFQWLSTEIESAVSIHRTLKDWWLGSLSLQQECTCVSLHDRWLWPVKPSVNLRLTQMVPFLGWFLSSCFVHTCVLPDHTDSHTPLTWPLRLSLWCSCPQTRWRPMWLLRFCTRDHKSCRTFQTTVKNTNYVIRNWAHLHLRIISFKTSNFKKCLFPDPGPMCPK